MKLNVLFHLHMGFPYHRAGAETMTHEIAKYLVKQGHKCRVVWATTQLIEPINQDGVQVEPMKTQGNGKLLSYYKEANVIITHLMATGPAVNMRMNAERLGYNRPLFFINHNHHNYNQLNYRKHTYIIDNSEWLQKLLYKGKERVLCRPLIFADDYKVKAPKRNHITLVNCNKNKGGHILIELAKRLPQYKFLGVEGHYAEQIKDNSLPNLSYMENQIDIREVWKRTKVCIMPSMVESWGRLAIEAMASRIPVICNPTNGLSECVKEAAIKIEPLEWGLDPSNQKMAKTSDIDKYEEAIIRLMEDTDHYKEQQAKGDERIKELDPLNDLQALERFLIKIASRNEYNKHQVKR